MPRTAQAPVVDTDEFDPATEPDDVNEQDESDALQVPPNEDEDDDGDVGMYSKLSVFHGFPFIALLSHASCHANTTR